jgi:hypothetical protein
MENEHPQADENQPMYRSVTGTLLTAAVEGGAVGVAHATTTQVINALRKPKDDPEPKK